MAKSILTLNSGSSSLKYSFKGEHGQVEDAEAFLEKLKAESIDAVGHRIVFGGDEFPNPILIDNDVLQKMRQLSQFAPLHMPSELSLIQLVKKHFPDLPQVACFDTSFHQTIPEKARIFGIHRDLEKEGIRRFGFHGLSYESVLDRLDSPPERLIIAHLGSGASICAVKNGKSIDTSMGLTPLGGVVMATRPGDVDPGVILYLMKEKKMSYDDLEQLLYFESGFKGLSGKSADIRDLVEDHEDVIEHFCYRIAKTIGSYAISLGGIDRLIYTGGIGEHMPDICEKISSQLKPIGLDKSKISSMPTEEEKMIEKHVIEVLG